MVRIVTEENSRMIQPAKMAATGRRVSERMAPLARGVTVPGECTADHSGVYPRQSER